VNILGNSQINELFLKFNHSELTYQKAVSLALGLRPGSASIKLLGQVHPCIIHSSSFSAARIILKISPTLLEELRLGSRLGVLKMSFQTSPSSPVEDFTLSGKYHLQSHQNAGDGALLLLIRLDFTHRPPEGFIEIQGRYLRLRADAEQRKDQRLTVDDDTLKILGFKSSKGDILIDNIPRKCVLREVSFGGSTIILGGVAKFLGEREFNLTLDMIQGGVLILPGQIIRSDPLEGYKAMAVLGLQYLSEKIPTDYLRAVQRGLDSESRPRPKPKTTPKPLVASVDTQNLTLKKN